MLTKSSENRVPEPIRHNVSGPNLKYTRTRCMRQGQYGAKFEIVCNYGSFVGHCPFHNRSVAGPRVADAGPMNCRPAMAFQKRNPIGRQVHVDH